jgi:hypothetical protein
VERPTTTDRRPTIELALRGGLPSAVNLLARHDKIDATLTRARDQHLTRLCWRVGAGGRARQNDFDWRVGGKIQAK